MKRFTETTIWDKPWYRKAPPRVKALWRYLCDHCDHAGVIDVDWELASFCIGEPVSLADLELLHSNAIERRGKVFLPGFVFFQYPGLSRDCKPHQPVFEALKRHQVDLSELTGSPMNGYSEGIESPMNGYSEGIESPMNEYSEGIESPMNEYSEGIESPTSRLSKPTRKRKGKGSEEEKDQKGVVGGNGVAVQCALLPGNGDLEGNQVCIPETLRTPEFEKAWSDWVEYRKERKRKLTKTGMKQQLSRLSKWGSGRAVKAIVLSIAQEWQGINEDNTNKPKEMTITHKNEHQGPLF